ncbi:MAG: molybdenum cofactor biosynthesis protein B [Myxococcota bacterium]
MPSKPQTPPKPHVHHRDTAPRAAGCYVLTVSDSRTPATDRSGALATELLEGGGHRIAGVGIVPDEPAGIREALSLRVADPDTDVIVITGGTGISKRDQTVDVVRGMVTRELPGFGELFRMLSFREIGSAAMLSRAFAGVAGETAIFVLPGSSGAVKLALDQLIVPEIGHILRELRKTGSN